MRSKKIKLAWIEKARSRATSLKKRKAGLLKKVEELSILCDVPACMIIFSPDEVTVWPCVEKARELLDKYFAMPEMEREKYETSLDSYLKKKTEKLREKVTKIQTKIKNSEIDKLMVQLQRGCNIDDLNLSDINQLISFHKDKVTCYRENLNLVQYPPLRDPPPVPNDFIGTSNGNKTYYLIDKWVFPSPGQPNPSINQQFQIRYMNGNPTLVMNEPIQYPSDVVSRGFGANEQGTSTVNHGDSNTLPITDGVRRESSPPPPPNQTSFDYEPDF